MVIETPGPTGTIFEVQRYSIDDGPGIRTTVFMKGCPLRCLWCQNPEGLRREVETDSRSGRIIGRRVTVQQLMSEVQRDSVFYRTSGGGVTVSGGEPLLQHAFVTALLRRCRAAGLDTALESSAHAPRPVLEEVVPLLDRLYVDLKLISSAAHNSYTGVDNDLILANARWLVRTGAPVTFRVPLVPEMTLEAGNIEDTALFLQGLGVREVELCPYRDHWRSKLGWVQREKEVPPIAEPDTEAISRAAAVFARHDVATRVLGR